MQVFKQKQTHINIISFLLQESTHKTDNNTLHRVGMSNYAHFGFEFTEKPTKKAFSELQTVSQTAKY
jgi:hypothetical protein